jgi:hypothetical protein
METKTRLELRMRLRLPSLRKRSLVTLTKEKVMTKYLLTKKAKANAPAADAAAVTDGKV